MSNRPIYSSQSIAVTLVVMFSSSFISLWLAYATGIGVAVAYFGLGLNILLGIPFWLGKRWAKSALLWRYLLNLVWAGALLLFLNDPIASALETAASVSMIALLAITPSTRAAFSVLTVYCTLLAVVALGMYQMVQRQNRMTAIVMEAGKPPRYESTFQYHLSLGGLPWKVLRKNQAMQLLGQNIPNADLHLIRHDGSSFGLFFPLQFRNVHLSEHLTNMLELEIQDKWLKGLVNWEKYPLKEGFLLTARGEAKGNGLSYAIFYKHFGNLGVYGIFWSEERHKERLIQEAELFYSNLTADPVKERLERLTPAELYRRSQEAVVLINTYNKEGKLNGKGSGFNISPKGLVVTNLHVLAQGHSVEVVFPGKGPIRNVVVVGMSPLKVDLALLKVEGAPLPALTSFKSVTVSPGDKVYVIGSPKGLVNTVSEGIVGGIRHDGSAQLYQITAPISHGSSGGPVFNEYGEVIGVANAMAVDAQNVNFSISIDELEKMTIFRHPMTTEALSEKLASPKGLP